jgi:diaminohydroxyphosphoribosylaminopyrimidine deaminase / 5-amino-6-(5-phosphoribosylamino)uracil reductase
VVDAPGTTARDAALMQRALALAARARGHTSPNPLVGAVVVDGTGVIVGDGYHRRAGTPHAEVHALDAAGDRARGATLYCTLEPCCHVGRTGPCVERIVAAGITRVVAAVTDPNPLVAGQGFAYLRGRGVEVVDGVEAAAARALNAPFFTWMRHGRPFVIAKAGTSLDGRIAARPGERTPITGPRAWRLVHRLRAEVDAIGVGSGTLLCDDPLLTARDVYRARPLVRVVFDRSLKTPPDARIFTTLKAGPVIVLTGERAVAAAPDRASRLEAAGARLVPSPGDSLEGALGSLGTAGVQSLLLEGGASLHAAAWDAGMIDRVLLLVAPRVLGPEGVPAFAGRPVATAALHDVRVEPCGDDVLIQGDVHRID